MLISQLPHNDQLFLGATHYIRVTHEDLTEAVADTDQTLTVSVEAGEAFRVVAFRLVETFEDQSDAALNDTKITIGDGGDADRFFTVTQVNENGTEVLYKSGALADPYIYTTTDTIDILVESMVGKSLSNIDKGIALFFVQKIDLDEYGDYK